jgi:hypothetical protein
MRPTPARLRARKLERADKADPMPCVSPDYTEKQENCWTVIWRDLAILHLLGRIVANVFRA